jgi:hypothetical protein
VTEVWTLPGYDVQALLGFGATGEVWRARELATGDTVALKRLRAGADPAALTALRREAALLGTLATPYVVRLRAVLGEDADTVLVLDLAAGGSLAALLGSRGRLDPGEVVTVAAPLAQALAAAHASGLVHGDVSPSNVLFTADGMPLLSDLGLARPVADPVGAVEGTAEYVDPAVAAGGRPDAASDVWALAAVCHHMLSGTPPHDGTSAEDVLQAARQGARAPLGLLAPTAPRALVAAVEQALRTDPAERPDAAAFAVALGRAHAAAPVRLSGAAPAAPGPDVRPTHAVHPGPAPVEAVPRARRLPPRRVLLAGAAVLAVGVAAAAGWLSGRAAPAGTAQLATAGSSSPTESTPRWAAVLDRLDAARAAVLATADAAGLSEVYAEGSPALAADRAAVGRLVAAGQTARGVRHAVRRVTQTAYDGRTARLRVVDVLAAYDVLDGSGRSVQHSPPRGEASYVVTLVRTPAGWRLQQVVPA